MHTLTYEKLQNIYPEMHSFLKVRKLLDEAEVFSNPYTEKLFTIMKKADKVLLVSFLVCRISCLTNALVK